MENILKIKGKNYSAMQNFNYPKIINIHHSSSICLNVWKTQYLKMDKTVIHFLKNFAYIFMYNIFDASFWYICWCYYKALKFPPWDTLTDVFEHACIGEANFCHASFTFHAKKYSLRLLRGYFKEFYNKFLL